MRAILYGAVGLLVLPLFWASLGCGKDASQNEDKIETASRPSPDIAKPNQPTAPVSAQPDTGAVKTSADILRLKKACDGGDMRGCAFLAINYASGRGVAKNLPMANRLYKKLCDSGHMSSCSELSTNYAVGRGIGKDPIQSNRLAKKACDGGYMYGCAILGMNHLRGFGVKKDAALARKLYEKACSGGNMMGCVGLGYVYRRGLGVPKDPIRANTLFKKACKGGEKAACKEVRQIDDKTRTSPSPSPGAAKPTQPTASAPMPVNLKPPSLASLKPPTRPGRGKPALPSIPGWRPEGTDALQRFCKKGSENILKPTAQAKGRYCHCFVTTYQKKFSQAAFDDMRRKAEAGDRVKLNALKASLSTVVGHCMKQLNAPGTTRPQAQTWADLAPGMRKGCLSRGEQGNLSKGETQLYCDCFMTRIKKAFTAAQLIAHGLKQKSGATDPETKRLNAKYFAIVKACAAVVDQKKK